MEDFGKIRGKKRKREKEKMNENIKMNENEGKVIKKKSKHFRYFRKKLVKEMVDL